MSFRRFTAQHIPCILFPFPCDNCKTSLPQGNDPKGLKQSNLACVRGSRLTFVWILVDVRSKIHKYIYIRYISRLQKDLYDINSSWQFLSIPDPKELLLFSAFLFGGFDIMCISVRAVLVFRTLWFGLRVLRKLRQVLFTEHWATRSGSFARTKPKPVLQNHVLQSLGSGRLNPSKSSNHSKLKPFLLCIGCTVGHGINQKKS